jgi:aryl carrier-like protein
MEKTHGLKGLDSIKTMKNVKKISVVEERGSSFLELYILEKEKERLLMESRLFSQKLDSIKRRLQEIEAEVERIQLVKGHLKKTIENRKNPSSIHPGKKEAKQLNKVRIDY